MSKFTKSELSFINEITLDQCHVPTFLLKHYADLGLTEKECLLMISVLNAVPNGCDFLNVCDLQKFLNINQADAESIVAGFVSKGFLTKINDKAINTKYSLKNLYMEMLELWVYLQACPEKQNDSNCTVCNETKVSADYIKQIYSLFEAEKGQPLSPTEIERLNHWIIDDNWSAEMIKEALSRAVMHGTCNFAYIDKILLRWKKTGIKVIQQLETEDEEVVVKKKAGKKVKNKEKILTNQTDYNDIYKL